MKAAGERCERGSEGCWGEELEGSEGRWGGVLEGE